MGTYGTLVTSGRVIELINESKPDWVTHITREGRLARYGIPPTEPQLAKVLGEDGLGKDVEVGWIRVIHDPSPDEPADLVELTRVVNEALGSEKPDMAITRSDGGDGRGEVSTASQVTLRRSGTDKKVALEFIMTQLALSPDEFCAFGDGSNDVGMLSWAGQSVTPSNATTACKECSGMVAAKTNDQDFIADVLNSWFA